MDRLEQQLNEADVSLKKSTEDQKLPERTTLAFENLTQQWCSPLLRVTDFADMLDACIQVVCDISSGSSHEIFARYRNPMPIESVSGHDSFIRHLSADNGLNKPERTLFFDHPTVEDVDFWTGPGL
ncbi:unnamed protein product [Heligmosomoides polygyrus]|uniref:Cytochrome P450 n=1 Tax=Heligmosomoides polygyrus TaxID=6339 RepID=A0A183G1D4_HELPZ|nr:unnamed protein product [Heligmosomoides polygyrus]